MSLRFDLGALLVAREPDADFDEVADDLFDIAADITDLSELGCLDLDERRTGKLGKTAGNLRFADAGRADHQDILGHHFVTQARIELLTAPAVAERNRHGALGLMLTDNVAVEFGNDLAGGKGGHGKSVSPGASSAMKWAGP
jgi:hypothetical protein